MDLGAADFKVDRLGSLQVLASITRASFVEWCVFVFPSLSQRQLDGHDMQTGTNH